jgi:hypothetical protein
MAAARKKAEAAADLEAAKARRQKIFIAAGVVLLVALVGFQLPGILSSGSGPSSSGAVADATAATTPPAAVPVKAPKSLLPHAIAKLPARDIFVAQVTDGSGSTATSVSAAAPTTEQGPAVRTKNFVVKDPFVPQVVVAPAARVSGTAGLSISQEKPTAPAAKPATAVKVSYIVVLKTFAGKGPASESAAARAVVAAKNAGLKDVIANDAVSAGKSGPHFTVFTGPYLTQAEAHAELLRAQRNGYSSAQTERLSGSSVSGGF